MAQSHRSRASDELKIQIAQEYEEGSTQEELAARHGFTRKTIRKYITEGNNLMVAELVDLGMSPSQQILASIRRAQRQAQTMRRLARRYRADAELWDERVDEIAAELDAASDPDEVKELRARLRDARQNLASKDRQSASYERLALDYQREADKLAGRYVDRLELSGSVDVDLSALSMEQLRRIEAGESLSDVLGG